MASLLSYALCSVADVKESLGITGSTQDNLIIRKINQATEMIEGYTGRRFKAADYTEYVDASHTDQLILKQRPINTITSIGSRDTSQNLDDFETVQGENYFFDANAGVVEGIFNFSGGWNRYKVVYNAGYTTIPSDLSEACVSLASFLVDNGTSGTNVKRKQEGQRSIEYFDTNSGASAQSMFEQLGIDEILNRYTNYPLLADK